MRPIAALTLLLAALTTPAQAEIRAQDAARLAGFHATAGEALIRAMAAGTPADVAALAKALSGPPQVAFDPSLQGDWSCRTLRLGGPEMLVVYARFKCRFKVSAQGFDFEKLSGSERTTGSILLREGQAVYLGVGYGAEDTPPAYADLPDQHDPNSSIQPQIALFERISPTRARLMFPAPSGNSLLDILELTR